MVIAPKQTIKTLSTLILTLFTSLKLKNTRNKQLVAGRNVMLTQWHSAWPCRTLSLLSEEHIQNNPLPKIITADPQAHSSSDTHSDPNPRCLTLPKVITLSLWTKNQSTKISWKRWSKGRFVKQKGVSPEKRGERELPNSILTSHLVRKGKETILLVQTASAINQFMVPHLQICSVPL